MGCADVTISRIRPTLLRRIVVVATVVCLVVALCGVWLIEAIMERVRRDFGEDINQAWRGES